MVWTHSARQRKSLPAPGLNENAALARPFQAVAIKVAIG